MTTQAEIYDWLLSRGVREPACIVMGTRHVAGNWEDISKVLPSGYVCRVGRLAIHVLGEGDSWPEVMRALVARMRNMP